MTVVFVIAMSAFNALFLNYLNKGQSYLPASFEFFREEDSLANSAYFGAAAIYGVGAIDFNLNNGSQETRFIIIESSALLNANNPLSNALPTREGLLIYKVQPGDNLSRIAANFGISLNTILWANKDLRPNSLQPGQEIVILPITGVLHQVRQGETLESIASQYDVAAERILSANPNLIPARIFDRSTIIIPDSRPAQTSQLSFSSGLPNLDGYFAIPTTGWNWGKLHNFNAVDIANACGTPIYAAAEGLVIEEDTSGWNNGYGRYILIEHPNGTKTKYAHNQRNLVAVGDYVIKGDSIAIIGNTGYTHGPTGCHLHFEVFGARNPFSK
jgi:murein DD-endopeptidase MepM/ murein hydrolase activator NlpD